MQTKERRYTNSNAHSITRKEFSGNESHTEAQKRSMAPLANSMPMSVNGDSVSQSAKQNKSAA